MRRLTLLLVGATVAFYGFHLIAEAGEAAPYVLRDGLLAALAGAWVFAVYAAAPVRPVLRLGRAWPEMGKLLFATGVACSLAAAGALTLLGSQGWPGWLGGSLWVLGLAGTGLGIFWPGSPAYGPPAYRWSLDAAGRFVRLALEEDAPAPQSGSSDAQPVWPAWGLAALLLVILGGWGLRLWRLAEWPPMCQAQECVQALQLAGGDWWGGVNASSFSLHMLLAALLYRFSAEALTALRWATALLACATLLAFAWAARAYARPTGALLATALLAFSPWHLWAGRAGGEWIAVPLLLLLALGTAARATIQPDARMWGMAGLALGLLLAQPVELYGATLLFALATAAAAAWAGLRRPAGAPGQSALLLLGSVLAVGLPPALPAWTVSFTSSTGHTPGALAAALAGLLHSGGAPLSYFLANPLLPPWTAALALAGLAALARPPVSARGLLALAGLAVYAGATALAPVPPEQAQTPSGLTLLSWLPFLLLGAAAALDQVMEAFAVAWGRLVAPARAATVALALLLILAGRDALTLTGQLRRAAGGDEDATELAMARFLADCLAGRLPDVPCTAQSEGAPTIYVPPAVLNHPATRLLAGPALENGRVQPLDLASDLLPASAPAGDLIYLVALDNQPLIELIQQLYPTAQRRGYQPPDEAGPTRFAIFTVPRAEVLAHQGLAGRYMPGLEGSASGGELRQDGPLAFAWSSQPPLAPPFHVVWEGSLLIPAAGPYLFRVEGIPPAAGDPVVSLQLDGRLVLDTSLRLVEQREMLPQGYVRLSLRYRTSAPPGDWAITWQPPNGAAEPIPRSALYSPPLPNIGLIGAYFAGSQATGQALTVRKDLVLGAEAPLPAPYSVRWTGKLAAPRAGEYLFAVTADGPLSLAVDGRPVLDHLPADPAGPLAGPEAAPAFSQASIYLDVGWRPIEISYAPPDDRPNLRLLWQPPGSSPMLLLSQYLLPSTAEVAPGDVPLPPAPDLLDARLGAGHFALSTRMELYQPTRALPPAGLPPLLAEQRWTLGNGCGAGAGQLDRPHGLALDPAAGKLYVADTGNRRIVEVDLATQAITQSYRNDAFQEPVAVELGPAGNLLVLDALVPAIFRIDRATGEMAPLALETGFYRPRGFAVDAAGNIAVADTGGARVVLLDPSGAVLAEYGGPQTLLGQGQPVDVLAAGGVLWTLTAENGRLWRLDVLGSLVVIERSNTIDGPHLAALPSGAFFLSDPAGRRVLHLAATGEPLAELAYPAAFDAPSGVAAGIVEGAGAGATYLAVADSGACRVSLWQVRVEGG
ncbi:MAG TPA: PA14 domain-containing protein [Caldilineaceae bacterium]|nr:PA14 domain-containing protein [Caldilineaceae bacterium]